jgi:hypothetical protein
METEVMLTTFDNPFDPFDEFTPWFLFDVEKGYNTCSLLARIARSSDSFSTIEDKKETERAIDKIIDNDFLSIYKKVTRTSEKEDSYTVADATDDDENDVSEDEEDRKTV